jgi:cell wall-associated NlpC family hydrolase
MALAFRHAVPLVPPVGTLFFFLLLVSTLIVAGCSATSPRFTSGGSGVPASDTHSEAKGKSRRDNSARESGASSRVAAKVSAPSEVRENNPGIDRHKVLDDIMEKMGVPYAEGGSDSEGTDCSGFTASIYRDAIGREIPRSCREQYAAGEPVERGKLRFGDLVFFNIDGRPLSHVGIYVGDGLFAHASVSLGITVSLLESEYYARSYAGARRVIP